MSKLTDALILAVLDNQTGNQVDPMETTEALIKVLVGMLRGIFKDDHESTRIALYGAMVMIEDVVIPCRDDVCRIHLVFHRLDQTGDVEAEKIVSTLTQMLAPIIATQEQKDVDRYIDLLRREIARESNTPSVMIHRPAQGRA